MSASKPLLLFLCQRLPFPLNKGEKIRAFHVARYLSQHCRLLIGTLVDDPEDLPHARAIEALAEDLFIARVGASKSKIGALEALMTGKAISFRAFESKDLKTWVDNHLATSQLAGVFVFSSNMAPYVCRSPACPNQFFMDFVDVDSEKFRAYAKSSRGLMGWVYDREARLVARWERQIADTAGWLGFVSQAEADVFVDRHPGFKEKALAVSNAVDTDYFAADPNRASPFASDHPTFVFTGAMDYAPNEEAVVWFAQSVMPALRQLAREVRFYIVGGRPTARVQALSRHGDIIVTGRVQDVRGYQQHASACVAPMKTARGIQNKVLEAMAMARPVIATPQALDGIDMDRSTTVLEAADAPALLAACRAVIEGRCDPNLGRRARRHVVEFYSWEARLAALKPFVSALNDTSGPGAITDG